MSLKLYLAPGACSFVPHVLLEQSGAAYEPVVLLLHKGQTQTPEYLAVNPRGQVPVLVADGQVVTQIMAICDTLDRRLPDAHIFPTEPHARAKFLETLAWMNNTVHPCFTHVFKPHYFSDKPEVQAEIKAYNLGKFRALLDEVQALVPDSGFMSGDKVGALDAYALTFIRWAGLVGQNPEDWPRLWAFAQRVAADPAVARASERERMPVSLYRPATAA